MTEGSQEIKRVLSVYLNHEELVILTNTESSKSFFNYQ